MRPNTSPLEFFAHLRWIDGTSLLKTIEPYRQRLFMETLYTFDADGRPLYNRVLTGRGKKNWKTSDLLLAGLYRFIVWKGAQGNDCAIIANDEGQAGDDLELLKKIIAINPLLAREVTVKQKEIERNDGRGRFVILPARDVAGLHGKTFLFIGYDEIHGYRNYDVMEALTMDPTRLDGLEWITSYASIYNTPGKPLFDLVLTGKRGDDLRMFFSWYAADFTTDPELQGEHTTSEQRANPSMASWNNPGYLEQQKRRLPTHKYRRLHLNLPGMPDGTYFDAERVLACIMAGRRELKPLPDVRYVGFVDMSGGSSDDAVLGIAHCDDVTGRAALDCVVSQTGRAPFNPRDAVRKFAAVLQTYRISNVTGDRYAGETFRADFSDLGISYTCSDLTKHEIYEVLEPKINAGEVELLDIPKVQEQLLGLVARGAKIDHLPGEHDDWINGAAGALVLAAKGTGLGDMEVITAINNAVPTSASLVGAAGSVLGTGSDLERLQEQRRQDRIVNTGGEERPTDWMNELL